MNTLLSRLDSLKLDRIDSGTVALYGISSAVFLVLVKATLDKRRNSSRPPYPPGPPPHFLLGNIRDVPMDQPWVEYAEWSRRYDSDIVSFSVPLCPRMVVVNSAKAVKLIFEQRVDCSDRPYSPMIDLMEWNFSTSLLYYSDGWKAHRRLIQRKFGPNAVAAFHPFLLDQVKGLLRTVLDEPNDIYNQMKVYTTKLPMVLAYGREVCEKNPDFGHTVEEAMANLAATMIPGENPLNLFPVLRYLPTWFPGVRRVHEHAVKTRKLTRAIRDGPFNDVKCAMNAGSSEPSLLATILEENNHKQPAARDNEDDIKGAVATSFVGAADTSMSTLTTAILALLLHSQVQARAQEELDRVVGRDRLPTFADQHQLPYIGAICREVLRWKVVLPMAVPHSCMRDGIYDGYFIPRGSIVIGNAWGILHDPEMYPNPEQFLPERFLSKDGRLNEDDPTAGFGFGRRICPGRYLAIDNLWLVLASLLACFDIVKSKDEHGKAIEPHAEWTATMLSHPLPYVCTMSLRDERARELVLRSQL